MSNLLFKLGYYKKIYDSYKHPDVYAVLYDISMHVSNNRKTQKKLKMIETKSHAIHGEHIRIYEDYEYGCKIITIRHGKKVIMTKYLMLRFTEEQYECDEDQCEM